MWSIDLLCTSPSLPRCCKTSMCTLPTAHWKWSAVSLDNLVGWGQKDVCVSALPMWVGAGETGNNNRDWGAERGEEYQCKNRIALLMAGVSWDWIGFSGCQAEWKHNGIMENSVCVCVWGRDDGVKQGLVVCFIFPMRGRNSRRARSFS